MNQSNRPTRSHLAKLIFGALGILSLGFGVSFFEFTAHADSAKKVEELRVEKPFVRLMPPGQKTTGAFLTLKNSSSQPWVLVKAESDSSEKVELHTHIQKDGMMKMVEIEKLTVPAKGQLVLRPGGDHIMLIGLKRDLKEGELIPLTLVFEGERKISLKAPVQKIENEMKSHQSGSASQSHHH